MLDTKSKNMRRLKVILIKLTILVPAIVLVSLYPRMGQVYEEKINEIETQASGITDEETDIEEALAVEGIDTNTETEYLMHLYLDQYQLINHFHLIFLIF